jgi:hypothetical protein
MAFSLKDMLDAAAKQATEAKDSFKTKEVKANDLKDGESMELKLILPEDQNFSVEAVMIEMGKDKNFRSYFSQNFPYSEEGTCQLADKVKALLMNPTAKAKYQPLLDNVNVKKYFFMPVFQLVVTYDGVTGLPESYKIVDNEVKYLRLTPAQSETLIQKVSLPAAFNKSGYGMFDRVLGKTLTISRKGSGKTDTKYSFDLGVDLEIKEEDLYKGVSVIDYIKTQILPDDKLSEAFTNYFMK